ncbi:MAG TPA: tetratricopeptide repeat protein [Acidobacteriaceae bacterium]|nr:tetratricopeptide repeat protein [Acidobacteriaceae bacterium]
MLRLTAVRCIAAIGTIFVTNVSLTTIVSAQTASCHSGMQMKPLPAPESLPAPIKMTGIGNSHLTITATPEAQAWFNQGLNLLHDFWDYESERAFEQGVRVDPNCAMCYWGLYHALMFRNGIPNAYTKQVLANAVRLKSHVSKHEQLYIETASASDDAVNAADPDDDPDTAKEIATWRQIVKDYPDDLQAKLFLADTLRDGYDDKGEPKKKQKEQIALIQEVLKVAPNDSAANHYWIHAVEASPHPEQALKSAALLASLAPASGHMVHMPGHIYFRTGDYAEAEHWFAASTAVEERYQREQHVVVDNDWNYIHNLMYSIANLMEEGKMQEATALSAKISGARGEFGPTLYTQSPRDGMSRLDPLLPVAMRTADWDAVHRMVKDRRPDAKLPNLNFLAGQMTEFTAGMQSAETGDVGAAEASSQRLDAELWRLSQRVHDEPAEKKPTLTAPAMAVVMPDAKAAPLLSNLSVMSLELRATILAAKKQLPEAKILFEEAGHEEKHLGYREPPAYIRPVGETEGAVLLRAGDAAGAHTAYAAALKERPNSGFSLYGMAQSSEAAGNTTTARDEYARFLTAWKNSDANRPELAHAHEYMGSQKVVAASAEMHP